MRLTTFVFALILIAFVPNANAQRINKTINSGWLFHKGEINISNQIINPEDWSPVNLPHTWNNEDAFDDEPGFYQGTAWYAKTLIVPREWKNKEVFLHFEGANQETEVYLNGKKAGAHVGGYTAFGFMENTGEGIGWAIIDDIENAEIKEEIIVDARAYHTIKEGKNGQGPAPIKTPKGWLNLAHGVRNCAAGMRYVLYMFMTDLKEPWKVIASPGGYFMAPEGEERIGDVSNVLFTNGWIEKPNGDICIYYGSSDTRMHVATTTVEKLIDYCQNTPIDGLRTHASVETLKKLIENNLQLIK